MDYFGIFKNALLHPKKFFKKTPKFSLKQLLIYFTLNLFLYYLISLLYNSFQLTGFTAPFLVTNQLFFILPLTIVGLTVLTGAFHLLAKLSGGDGEFSGSIKAVILASPPIIFSGLPILGTVTFFYQIYLLILAFKFIHHLSYIKSSISIILPLLALQILLTALNFSSVMTS